MPSYTPTHRAPRQPRRRGRGYVAGAVAVLVVVGAVVGGVAWSNAGDDGGDPSRDASAEPTSSPTPSPTPDTATDPAVDPDEPTSWGPTVGELTEARELVERWSAAQLAGQVIIGRYDGFDPELPAQLVRDLHLAGVTMTKQNVSDAAQVAATSAAVADAVAADGRDFPPVMGVDQEGGLVAHLDGVATHFPAFAEAGAAIATDAETGSKLVEEATAAAGLELRSLGFTWVYAPVADVTIGTADPTIGSRSASGDPEIAAQATRAAVAGYSGAGVVSTTKHFPGHGSATADSHLVVPLVDAPLAELRERDLEPFEAAVRAQAPAIMVSHLDVQAIAPGVPGSMAPQMYDYLREELGFEGVAITDSLGMGSVSGRERPAVTAFLAGADLLLMPADTRRAHATLTAAIENGEVPRERAEESAARVVALQLWQQRMAAEVPVPDDVTTQAQAAAAALAAG